MKIFICYHKNYPISKTTSDILIPIHVGKALSKENLGFIGDNTGDNISEKNPYFCELTATYWIWKNITEDIVGLCHYRRYFNFKNDRLKTTSSQKNLYKWLGNNSKNIEPFFKKYDCILPVKMGSTKYPVSLYDYYANGHSQKDIDLVLDIIHTKHPEQYLQANKILHTYTQGYYANMLIAKKEIFNNYASWLFDILFELEKRIQSDVIKRDNYQRRAYGFLSERLLTVYFSLHPEIKIKEIPVTFIEENKKAYMKYIIRYWKRKLFNIFRKEKHG